VHPAPGMRLQRRNTSISSTRPRMADLPHALRHLNGRVIYSAVITVVSQARPAYDAHSRAENVEPFLCLVLSFAGAKHVVSL
jgi:hypothetical protein